VQRFSGRLLLIFFVFVGRVVRIARVVLRIARVVLRVIRVVGRQRKFVLDISAYEQQWILWCRVLLLNAVLLRCGEPLLLQGQFRGLFKLFQLEANVCLAQSCIKEIRLLAVLPIDVAYQKKTGYQYEYC
jgi:hypothetical protein